MNESLWISLSACTCATLINVPLAIAGGWVISRHCRWRFKAVFNLIALLPMILPPVVLGMILLWTLGPSSWIGSRIESLFGFSLAFSWKGVVCTSACVGFPFFILSLKTAWNRIDPRYWILSHQMRWGRFALIRKLILPNLFPSILTGGLLSFSRGLGEFGATVLFAGNTPGISRTLTLGLVQALDQGGGFESAAPYAIALSALGILAYLLSEMLSPSNPR